MREERPQAETGLARLCCVCKLLADGNKYILYNGTTVGYVFIAGGPSEYLRHSPIMKLDSGLTGANRRANHFTVRPVKESHFLNLKQYCFNFVIFNSTKENNKTGTNLDQIQFSGMARLIYKCNDWFKMVQRLDSGLLLYDFKRINETTTLYKKAWATLNNYVKNATEHSNCKMFKVCLWSYLWKISVQHVKKYKDEAVWLHEKKEFWWPKCQRKWSSTWLQEIQMI